MDEPPAPAPPPKKRKARERRIIGRRECVDLPDLGLERLDAKIDSGAWTSSLHVDTIARFEGEDGSAWATIGRKDASTSRSWRVRPKKFRKVKSSNGSVEERATIHTLLRIGDLEYEIDITLTNRKGMKHELLIGRSALRRRFLIDPSRSYLLDKNPA